MENTIKKEPIDNADKKNFFQWIIGKGIKYTVLEIFIWAFYFICSPVIIYQMYGSDIMDKSGWILILVLNLMFWGNLYKTWQNYQDDRKGETR